LPAEQMPLGPLPHWGRGGNFLLANNDHAGIAPLLDRLGARLGLAALSRIEPHQSHIPERASIAVPAGEGNNRQIHEKRRLSSPSPSQGAERVGVRWGMPEHSSAPTSPGRRSASATLSPLKGGEGITRVAKPPRPIRLFAPPEPIEASWLLPDDPPFRFTWRRRAHRVRCADGPERIAEEWWTGDGFAAALFSPGDIRDYYRVEDEEGRRFWLFRAGLADGIRTGPPPRWFVHGLFA